MLKMKVNKAIVICQLNIYLLTLHLVSDFGLKKKLDAKEATSLI